MRVYKTNPIKIFPDKSLLTPTIPVVEFIPEEVAETIDTMKSIVEDFKAFGLAANQIGEEDSVVMINAEFKGIMINPVITKQKNLVLSKERCLSFPGVEVNIKRFNNITVQYLTESFEEIVQDFEGTDAIVIQHEVRHLLGKTIYSDASPIDKPRIMRKLIKAKRYFKKNR